MSLRLRVALLFVVAVGASGAVLVATAWWLPLERSRPGWPVLPLAAVVALVVVASAGVLLVGPRWRLRLGALLVTLLGCLAVAGLVASGSLLQAAWPQDLTAADVTSHGASWTVAVRHESAARPMYCAPALPMDRQLPGWGRVDSVCSTRGIGGLQVSFVHAASANDPLGGSARSLEYLSQSASAQELWDQCVWHISGPWWEAQSPADAGGCPQGWVFVGGP